MTVTETSDLLVPEIVTDTVQARLRRKNALMGSILVASGAVVINGSMPESGPEVIGKTVRIPYFGTLGEFEDNAEGSSATPKKIKQTYEDATVARKSLAFEVSRWASGVGSLTGGDPYEESARQVEVAAERSIDKQLVAAGRGSALLADYYSATTPHFMSYGDVVRAKSSKMGDEQSDIVAMVVHSLVAGDLAAQVDNVGRPLLATPSDGSVPRVAGIPILMSDSMPLNGSSMGTVTHTGTGSATYSLLVADATEMGPWDLKIEILSTGEAGAATLKFSTDGGNTWSDTLTSAATGVALALTDTAEDSLVGNNGKTGLTIAFTSGAGDDLVDGDTYESTAKLCCESQIWTRGSGAFWYNAAALRMLTEPDILEDTMIGAMHLYGVAHAYRRRVGGSRPGVVRVRTNTQSYIG